MNWRHVRVLAVLPLSLVAGLLSACANDECAGHEARCDGDLAKNCQETGNGELHTWAEQQCQPGTCKTDSFSAFCAIHGALEPNCGPLDIDICVGSSQVSCESGYAVSSYDCASGAFETASASVPKDDFGRSVKLVSSPLGAVCSPIAGRTQAFCAAAAERNPDCPFKSTTATPGAATYSAACVLNEALNCVNGYLVSRQDCGDGTCKDSSGIKSSCELPAHPEPDPTCARGMPSTHCEGDAIVSCTTEGYRLSKEACAAAKVCRSIRVCSGSSPECAVANCAAE